MGGNLVFDVEHAADIRHSGGHPTRRLAEGDGRMNPHVTHHLGLRDVADDTTRRPEDARLRMLRGEHVDALDTVLQAHHHGIAAEVRPDLVERVG